MDIEVLTLRCGVGAEDAVCHLEGAAPCLNGAPMGPRAVVVEDARNHLKGAPHDVNSPAVCGMVGEEVAAVESDRTLLDVHPPSQAERTVGGAAGHVDAAQQEGEAGRNVDVETAHVVLKVEEHRAWHRRLDRQVTCQRDT